MTERNFAEQVVEILGDARIVETNKANGIVKIGVSKENGEVATPVIYVDTFIERGATPKEVADFISNFKGEQNINVDFISDYEQVKPLLRARLYNNRTVADVYCDATQYGFPGLRIIPYIELTNINGSIKVSSNMLDTWDVTKRNVIDDAMNNSSKDVCIATMMDVLRGLHVSSIEDFIPSETDVPMYVVTNKRKTFGASAVLFAKTGLELIFGDGYVVLPSSVHETIVVPKSARNIDDLVALVNEVNKTQVSPEEQLGDTVYQF